MLEVGVFGEQSLCVPGGKAEVPLIGDEPSLGVAAVGMPAGRVEG